MNLESFTEAMNAFYI